MTRHWADDSYWIEASRRYAELQSRGTRELKIDLDTVRETIFDSDGPAYKLMEAMESVKEHEGYDGFRGAPRLVLALLAKLAELGNTVSGTGQQNSHNLWLGRSFSKPENRILVLGESWYGDATDLSDYIERWIQARQRDATFARIFNACSGRNTASAGEDERRDFWDSIAFYNFVLNRVAKRKNRPKPSDFTAGIPALREVLRDLKPAGVWILGVEQSRYSVDVARESGAAVEVVPHPTSYGLTTDELRRSWNALRRQLA